MTGLGVNLKKSRLHNVGDLGGARDSIPFEQFSESESLWEPVNFDDNMCQIDDDDNVSLGESMKFTANLLSTDCNQEPNDEWPCKFDDSPELKSETESLSRQLCQMAGYDYLGTGYQFGVHLQQDHHIRKFTCMQKKGAFLFSK